MLTREQIEEVRRRGIDYHTTDWFAKLVNGTCDLALEALSAREPNPPVIPDSSQPVERSEVCGYCKGLKQLHYGEGKDNCHVCQGTGRKPKSEVCDWCEGEGEIPCTDHPKTCKEQCTKCKGTGRKPKESKGCVHCGGSGKESCAPPGFTQACSYCSWIK